MMLFLRTGPEGDEASSPAGRSRPLGLLLPPAPLPVSKLMTMLLRRAAGGAFGSGGAPSGVMPSGSGATADRPPMRCDMPAMIDGLSCCVAGGGSFNGDETTTSGGSLSSMLVRGGGLVGVDAPSLVITMFGFIPFDVGVLSKIIAALVGSAAGKFDAALRSGAARGSSDADFASSFLVKYLEAL